MKRTILVVIVFFCTLHNSFSQNSKSSYHFKSIRIENGDTIVEEKNVESDDPNFSFTDSLLNGGFSIHSGKNISPGQMFPDFGMNSMQPFQSPIFNDSIFNSFFHQPIQDSVLIKQYFPDFRFEEYETPQTTIPENNMQNDINFYFVQGTDLLNISFMLSPDKETILKILNQQNEVVFEEQFDKSSAYFVKQIDVKNFNDGKYTIMLHQGDLQRSKSITIGN